MPFRIQDDAEKAYVRRFFVLVFEFPRVCILYRVHPVLITVRRLPDITPATFIEQRLDLL